MKKNNPIRHGEIILQPVDKLPKQEFKAHKSFIVGHSETGHHHVLESKEEFKVLDMDGLWLEITKPTKLVHKKVTYQHKTLPVAPGKYKVIKKTEYDPWDGLIREVHD